jgi:hypothetical protein
MRGVTRLSQKAVMMAVGLRMMAAVLSMMMLKKIPTDFFPLVYANHFVNFMQSILSVEIRWRICKNTSVHA